MRIGGITSPYASAWRMIWPGQMRVRGASSGEQDAVIAGITGAGAAAEAEKAAGVRGTEKTGEIPGDKDSVKKPGRRSSPKECQTCKERKYQDGSDENVSFKSAQHVSPESAGSRVRAHEGEHVSNAYSKAEESGGKVVQASVSIHTAICPECGRVYVSGGTTHTKISYPNEDNPYQKDRKMQQGMGLRGENMDVAV